MSNRDRKAPRGLGTIAGLATFAVTMVGFMIGSPLAAASANPNSSAGSKPALSPGSPVFAPRPQPAGGLRSGLGSAPSPGQAPTTNGSAVSRRAVGGGKSATTHKAAPALLPKTGRVVQGTAPAPVNQNRAEVNGQVHLGPSHKGAGPLLTAAPSSHPATAKGFTPSTFYSSTQLDNFSAECGFGVNETTIAQSTDNPSLLVAGANTYYDNSGNCQDSHTGVYYSSDGGQHWKFEVMPGLQFPGSGDPEVTYDPVRHVFVFAFVEFNRSDDSMGRIGVEASSDGVNWSRNTTLDSSNSSDGTDKPSIAVDQNPASPHYGRVAVAWTEFFGNNAVYQEDYTDDGGASWHTSGSSVNFTNHECGNGTSAAFNAGGELMIAWADCSGGVNSMYEELSTTGGASWTAPADVQITTTTPIEGAEQNTAANCALNNGGSAFRCNSFPSLAGDPNGGDAGGQAFFIVWANVDSTTQNSQTANVAQLHGLSTVNDGTNWNNGSFSFAFMANNDFGDKFFPAASFSPSGRLTVSYSDRENDASTGNPNGRRYNEHQTEASSLTNLRSNSYVTYTTDGTLGDPGSLAFIGDYAGNTSLDDNFDTFPVWTDLRNGFPSARTQDLCYVDCMTSLSPGATFSVSRTAGSSFQDFYSLSMDPSTGGSGANFWNVVGLRPGTDGTSVDDDLLLAPNRYYNSALASSSQSPPRDDYVVINGNTGHAPNTVYFPRVSSFSTAGGSYSLQWEPGQIVLGSTRADSMAANDVARVYDSFLSTGTTYFFGLRPNSGNTSSYSLALHSASSASEQGRASAVSDSGNVPAGAPAFVKYNTGANASQFDGLVALNNNGGSGSYTLYRDTVVPDGTIQINGGAASTNNVKLNLALSSDNATASDPVTDMAFSVNGGPFGAFRRFVTSTTINVPSGDGTKTVSVEYRNAAGGVSAPVSASIYLVQHAPTVTSVNPTGGSTAGGNWVTINGTNLAPGATVNFGSTTSSTVAFVSATQIKARAPAHALGSVHVTVTTPAGTSPATSADRYAYAAPTVTSVSPVGGSTAGGNTVTIGGTNFVAGMTVRFGTTASTSVTFVSATQVKAKAPARAAGTVDVIVTTAAGTSPTSNADKYAYGAPTISSLTPTSGSTAGGNTVTINGSGFVPGVTVKFGGGPSSLVTFVSGTQITAKVPAHAAGTVRVAVITAAGTSASTNADLYAYGAPTISSLSPAGGPTAGGNTVTINGNGFVSGVTVKFGGAPSTLVTLVSGTQIKAKVPAHTAGTARIAVITAAGTSASTNADLYAYGAPTASSLSPNTGPTAGGNTVTINGSGFVPGATVKFGTTASSSVTFVSGTQIKAKAPAHAAGAVNVRVTTPAGTSAASSANRYTY